MHVERLSMLARARIPLSRRALRAVLSTTALGDWLARSRRDEVQGRTLAPDLAAVLRLDDLTHASQLRGHSPARARLRLAEQIAIVDGPPPAGVATRDLTFVGPASDLALRVYEPDGVPEPAPAIVYIHGGGFVTCSVATHDGFCRRLALGARAKVFSLDYRLAPEHPYPAAVDDALAGFRWVAEHAERLGADPRRVGVAGDSAGGNLSAVVSRLAHGDPTPPALAVLFYPATDATCSLPSHQSLGDRYFLTRDNIAWYYDHYAPPGVNRRKPDVSPLYADPSGACRTMIYVCGFDPLRDEGVAYAEKLRAAGVPVELEELPGQIHGFLLMSEVPSSRAATTRIAARIGEALRTDRLG
ncbi:MAG: alpha/beta hydrolase [Myxococcales bacterium]|nr:alpha/beta hydrolase [Myxococcales bacterium]